MLASAPALLSAGSRRWLARQTALWLRRSLAPERRALLREVGWRPELLALYPSGIPEAVAVGGGGVNAFADDYDYEEGTEEEEEDEEEFDIIFGATKKSAPASSPIPAFAAPKAPSPSPPTLLSPAAELRRVAAAAARAAAAAEAAGGVAPPPKDVRRWARAVVALAAEQEPQQLRTQRQRRLQQQQLGFGFGGAPSSSSCPLPRRRRHCRERSSPRWPRPTCLGSPVPEPLP